MLKNTMGLILADNCRVRLGALSEPRALAAMPFAGRFRIIDFMLSNMVNSGIKRVGVIALTRYRSLMDHIGTGSWWDLDRMNQGLHLLPPYVNPETRSAERSDTTSILDYIRAGQQEYIVLADCNMVMNIALGPIVAEHIKSAADITVLYNRGNQDNLGRGISLALDEAGWVVDVRVEADYNAKSALSVGVVVISRELMIQILEDNLSHGITFFSFARLLEYYKFLRMRGQRYDGFLLRINSIADYFNASMSLFDENVRRQLFDLQRPIFTKVKNLAPCVVEPGGKVKNVLASDGCVIQGEVENCILFRGVVVGKAAKIKNCVLFQDVQISDCVNLDHVIIDKDSVVKMGVKLLGHPGFPVVIGKGVIV